MISKLKLSKLCFLSSVVVSIQSFANSYAPPQCVDGRTGSDLKVEAPIYIAVGMPTTIKGDFPFVWDDETKSVNFNNSYEGYIGYDNTDTWDNAYIDMTFPLSAVGPVVIWAIDETNPLQLWCSKTSALVQTIPTITNTSVQSG